MSRCWLDQESWVGDHIGRSNQLRYELLNVQLDSATQDYRRVIGTSLVGDKNGLTPDPYGRTGIPPFQAHPLTLTDPVPMVANDYLVVERPTDTLLKVLVVYTTFRVPSIRGSDWRVSTGTVGHTKRLIHDLDGVLIGGREYESTTGVDADGSYQDHALQATALVRWPYSATSPIGPRNSSPIEIEDGRMQLRLAKTVSRMSLAIELAAAGGVFKSNKAKWRVFPADSLLVTQCQIEETESFTSAGSPILAYDIVVDLLYDDQASWSTFRIYDSAQTQGGGQSLITVTSNRIPADENGFAYTDFRVRGQIDLDSYLGMFA